ncbi:hypothetical protein H8958_015887 [Nasalis larvatus]
MGRKEVLKAQIPKPCQRLRTLMLEGKETGTLQEPQGELELEACGPRRVEVAAMTKSHSHHPAIHPEPTEWRTAQRGLSHFLTAKAGTRAREAKEAVQVQQLSE